jgi:hypothetical protein
MQAEGGLVHSTAASTCAREREEKLGNREHMHTNRESVRGAAYDPQIACGYEPRNGFSSSTQGVHGSRMAQSAWERDDREHGTKESWRQGEVVRL